MQPSVGLYGVSSAFGEGSNLFGPWDDSSVDTVVAGTEQVQSVMFGGQLSYSDVSGLLIKNTFIGMMNTNGNFAGANYTSIHDMQFSYDGLPLLTQSMDNGFALYNVNFNVNAGTWINGGTWQHRTDAQLGWGGYGVPSFIGAIYVPQTGLPTSGVSSAIDDWFAAEFWHPEFSAKALDFPETCAFPQTANQRQTSRTLDSAINAANWMCLKGATGFGWVNISRDDFSVPTAWPATYMYANGLTRPMYYGTIGGGTFSNYGCEECNSLTTDPYRAEAKQEGIIEFVHSSVYQGATFNWLGYDYNGSGTGTITQEIYDISAGGFPASSNWSGLYADHIVSPLPSTNLNLYHTYNLASASGPPNCLQVGNQSTGGAITNTGSPCGSVGSGTGFNGGAGTSFQDALEIAAPANPASTYDRLYLDSTAHQLKCLTSSGGSCMPVGSGTVTTSGSPVSPNVAAFSSSTAITAATSANIQTAIGAGVYDASGAAAARQANLSLVAGTYADGKMCTYALSGTLLNCNTAIPSVGTWGALNYPTWVSGTPFVKMTAAGTFALDTSTYLTASGISGMTAGQVPIAATATTVTSSKAIQGTDTNLMSSGTISGTSVLLCTDANGGATTTSCPAVGSGVVTAAAQYDVPYYTQAGSTAQVGGAAIAGFQYDSTGGAPAAATQGNLGTLINVTSGQALISGGSGSAVTGKALAGSGAGLTTGPASGVTSGDISTYTGTGGQLADGGTFASNIPAQYKTWSCQPGLGDGLNAITAGTYLQSTCMNTTGVTVTLTGLKCFTDNAGSSTLNASGNTLGALLTGAITCSASFAAGSQSANVALTNGDYVKFTFVADGTSKQATWVVTGTY